MNTILISAGGKSANTFGERIKSLAEHIIARGNSIIHHNISEMNINFCTGCFTCWWKTPGRCMFKDNMGFLYPEIIQSDLLIFASPLEMGLPSWRIKQLQDRLLPLLHPYITLVEGECHHRKRYERYPDIALVLEKEADTGTEDVELIKTLHRRLALNFHANLRGIGLTDMSNEEIYNEIFSN